MNKNDYNKFIEMDKVANQLVDSFTNVSNSSNSDDELNTFMKDESNRKELESRLSDSQAASQRFRDILNRDIEADSEFLVTRIRKADKQRNIRTIKILSSISIAAAMLFFSFLVWQNRSNNESLDFISTDYKYNSSVDVPTLIDENGTEILLKDGVDEIQDNGMIVEANENRIRFVNTSDTMAARRAQYIEYRTIKVPSRYTYKIILADETEVTLNANSEMRFPTSFNGETRSVELKGEAYFKVKPMSQPFIVEAAECQIRVYGTEFNVNARDFNLVKTLLVKGSVGIGVKNNQPTMLKPNQMGCWSSAKKMYEILEVNPNDYLGWMSQYIAFNDAKIEVLLNELSSWYGVGFIYDKEEFSGMLFNLSILRERDINSALLALKQVMSIEIKLKEGGIYDIKRL